MPKIYRVMKREGDFPRIGSTSTSLGVRIPQDIEPDENRMVGPGGRGMSVSPSMRTLPSIFLPRRLCRDHPDLSKGALGSDNYFVWSMGVGPFVADKVAPGLNLRPDQPVGANTASSNRRKSPMLTATAKRFTRLASNGRSMRTKT